MFAKNDLTKGGSFYIQSKIWCAKEEIMKDFPGAEEEFYKKHGVTDPARGKKAEADPEEKKGTRTEENKEGAEEKKEDKKEEKKAE